MARSSTWRPGVLRRGRAPAREPSSPAGPRDVRAPLDDERHGHGRGRRHRVRRQLRRERRGPVHDLEKRRHRVLGGAHRRHHSPPFLRAARVRETRSLARRRSTSRRRARSRARERAARRLRARPALVFARNSLPWPSLGDPDRPFDGASTSTSMRTLPFERCPTQHASCWVLGLIDRRSKRTSRRP